MAGAGNRSKGSSRMAGGAVATKAPRRVSGAGPGSTVLKDRGTRSFRRSAAGPYGSGGRNERLMAAAGRMSPSMMTNYPGRGGKGYLARRVSGDFYRPGTGDKFIGEATRRGNRVKVAEQRARDYSFTGQTYNYRISDRPGVRPVGAPTFRRRLPG
jgi:hypothetical protein